MKWNDKELGTRNSFSELGKWLFWQIFEANPVMVGVTGISLAVLPSEVLLKILSYLSHRDLNSVARVSKRLHQLGTDPWLWTSFNLKVKFKKIESHRVLFIAQTLTRVTKISRLRYLNHIDLCDNDLSSVKCEVLSMIWAKLPLSCKVILPQVPLSTSWRTVISAIRTWPPNKWRISSPWWHQQLGWTSWTSGGITWGKTLLQFDLQNKIVNICRSVPSQVLATTINRLEEVNLWSCNLTKTQVYNNLTAIQRLSFKWPVNFINWTFSFLKIIPLYYRCWNSLKKCLQELP